MLPFQKKRPEKSSGASAFAWHVNFRNSAELPDTRVVRTAFFFNTASILLAAALLLLGIFQEYRLYNLKADLESWQKQIKDNKAKSDQGIATYKKFKAEEQKILELDTYLKKDKLVLSDFIIRLGETLPQGIVLLSLDYRDQSVLLRGDVRGQPELASGMASAYEKQLRDDAKIRTVFDSVSLTTLARDAGTGRLIFVMMLKQSSTPKAKK
jgi:hypothetical protein